MKKFVLSLGLGLLAFAPAAHAGLGFDGCYQLFETGSLSPAFCLEGTAEEGINGAGVRLVIFRTNTDRVAHCSKSSASGMTANSFQYELNGQTEMSLEKVKTENGLKQGEAVFGQTRLQFSEIDQATTDRLLRTARKDDACLKAGW